MNHNKLVIASAIALMAFLAVPAQADTVAGWDFSQYRGPGSLTPEGNTVPANYSILDPTRGAGSESGALGTAYFDGSFGSTSTTTLFLPLAGSGNCFRANTAGAAGCTQALTRGPILSNRSTPMRDLSDDSIVAGRSAFDAHWLPIEGGQTFSNKLAMRAVSDVSVVFEVDLSSLSTSANEWSVSFGGRTFPALACGASCDATVSFDFSIDGVNYGKFGSVDLDTVDTPYRVSLSSVPTDTAYVRMNIANGASQAMIDNVSVEATPLPEPGTTAQLLAGVVSLLALHRFRA